MEEQRKKLTQMFVLTGLAFLKIFAEITALANTFKES